MASLKRLSGIILCVFAILLMSHNSYALSYNGVYHPAYVVNNTAMVYYSLYPNEGWVNQTAMNNNGGVSFSIPADSIQVRNVNRFVLNMNTNLKNSLVTIPYRVCFNFVPDVSAWIGFGSASQSSIVSNYFTFEGSSCLAGHVVVYSGTSNSYNIFLGGYDNGSVIGAFNNGFSIVFGMPSGIYLSDDADYTSVLNAIKNNTDDIKSKLDEIADSADAALDREESETQDAADDSSSAGSSSSSDATAATSSLISVIGGFVNVLTSAQPTNCKINANLNHIDMGQLDLCANPVPSYIQIIGSIILICAAIPLAIVLFNRFIGLFRSFQG